MDPLDLYATIEPLIGFDAQYEKLYTHYVKSLQGLHVTRVLDIGCGNGRFLQHLKNAGIAAIGIDRSTVMVARAKVLGVDARVAELSDFEEGSFDAITAVADVLNYLSREELERFMDEVARLLRVGGHFIADINTLFGFEQVTDGVMLKEEGKHFLAIEANFEEPMLYTRIHLFTQEEGIYRKESGEIVQYYHAPQLLKTLCKLEYRRAQKITLFSQTQPDKMVITWVKTASK